MIRILDIALETPGDGTKVLRDRRIEVDGALRAWTHDELFHVEVGRVQQAALLGRSKDGDRAGSAGRAEVRSLERIHGDVYPREAEAGVTDTGCKPQTLTDEEHRRFVPLAFPDDDGAVDRHRVETLPHSLDRRAIGLWPSPCPIVCAHAIAACSTTRRNSSERSELIA